MRYLLFLLFYFSVSPLLGQPNDVKRDFQWLVGYKDSVEKTVINLLDFNETGLAPVITPFQVLDGALPSRSIAVICDTSGHVLLYTNGCNILNKSAEIISNGDQVTPDSWVYENFCPDYYRFTGSWLFLPDPAKDSLYYLFAIGHSEGTGDGLYAWGLYASHLSEDEVIEKNALVCADSIFGGHLTACRHANGRDWWILLNKISTNKYYKYLLDPSGIHYMDIQGIGMPSAWGGSGSGQCAFSPDGTTFIHYENVADMFVYDFDRCTGQLSNFKHVNIEHNEDTGNSFGGMAISPNSRFAYTFGYLHAFQVDLQAPDLQASVTQVAYWDSTFVFAWKTTFGKAALAPNGRIYSAVPGANPYLHVIHNPNAKGDSCQFAQHELFLPYSWNNNDIVNYPNYRLGSMEGSACDSVFTGLKEHEQATDIQIVPNPNNGNFQISLPSGIITDWNFELFDLNGRSQWQSSTPNDFVQISDIPSGFYFLICSNKLDGCKVAKRLVIQQ